jgi:hypothetical protein
MLESHSALLLVPEDAPKASSEDCASVNARAGILFHFPGRNPPKGAVKRPVRPYKGVTER